MLERLKYIYLPWIATTFLETEVLEDSAQVLTGETPSYLCLEVGPGA